MRILNLPLLLAVGLLICFGPGCTAIKSRLSQNSPLPSMAKEKLSQPKSKAAQTETGTTQPDFETPVKMLALWKDSVRMEDNGSAMRGFGGRLYLYNGKGNPVRSEGDLVIYGFDDSVTNRQGSKADRKIVIHNQQLQQHYSESALGPSYSVWISWDRVGSIDKNVTLVPFFRPKDGKIVQAGQAIYTLHTPGKKTDTLHKEKISAFKQAPPSVNPAANQISANQISANQISPNQVSQVSYLENDKGQRQTAASRSRQPHTSQAPRSNVRTTTISLPRATQQRLRSSDFGTQSRGETHTTLAQPTADRETAANSKPSRIEEARQVRKDQIKEGNVFGMPGQL